VGVNGSFGFESRHSTPRRPPSRIEDKMQDSYRTIAVKLANREPFKGNSLTAYWWGDTYRVVSYSTLIASRYILGDTWISPDKYSVTTSRHQNLIKKAWGI